MRFITLNTENKVISVRTGITIVQGEIQSDTGELGQVLQLNGTFITPEAIPSTPTPTIEERLTGIEDTQDLILLRLEGVII